MEEDNKTKTDESKDVIQREFLQNGDRFTLRDGTKIMVMVRDNRILPVPTRLFHQAFSHFVIIEEPDFHSETFGFDNVIGKTIVTSVELDSNACWAKKLGTNRHIPIIEGSPADTKEFTVTLKSTIRQDVWSDYIIIDAYFGCQSPHLPEDRNANLRKSLAFWAGHAFLVQSGSEAEAQLIDVATKTNVNPYQKLIGRK